MTLQECGFPTSPRASCGARAGPERRQLLRGVHVIRVGEVAALHQQDVRASGEVAAGARVAERVLAKQGWGAWPACSRKLGLSGIPPKLGAAPQARPSTSAPAAAPSGRTVRVAAGDTLSKIAAAYGVAGGWQALHDANPSLGNPNTLQIGTLLQMP